MSQKPSTNIVQDVVRGWRGNFHALKWRIAMSVASRSMTRIVPVAEIRRTFDGLFHDREALRGATGWSAAEIATIDYYASASHGLVYPPLSELLTMAAPIFASVGVIPACHYPLCERCPTIVLEKADVIAA